MFDNFGHFFKKVVKQEPVEEIESKSAAKERLQLVLMQDRANVSADFLELMKKEIIDVVKKYIIVDEEAIDVRLTTQVNEDGTNGEPTLYANIPIVNIRNELKAERITDQLNISDLIEEQAKQEAEKLENKENKQLFNMSDTQRTVIITDETLEKVNSELITTKEREAKLEEKKQKQEEKEQKREEGRRVKQAQEESKENSKEIANEVKEAVNTEKKFEENKQKEKSEGKHAAVEQKHSQGKRFKEESKENKKEEAKADNKTESKVEEPVAQIEQEDDENDEVVVHEESEEEKKAAKEKEENKAKNVKEYLIRYIVDEIAELDDLEKELFSTANDSEENDEEDEDFVTFDDLYAKAQEEDKLKEKKN